MHPASNEHTDRLPAKRLWRLCEHETRRQAGASHGRQGRRERGERWVREDTRCSETEDRHVARCQVHHVRKYNDCFCVNTNDKKSITFPDTGAWGHDYQLCPSIYDHLSRDIDIKIIIIFPYFKENRVPRLRRLQSTYVCLPLSNVKTTHGRFVWKTCRAQQRHASLLAPRGAHPENNFSAFGTQTWCCWMCNTKHQHSQENRLTCTDDRPISRRQTHV